MTARGDSLGYSRNPGSNYYAGLTHQLMIDLDADDAARVSAFHFAVGRQSRWQTTTGCSAPALRFGTLALAVGAACGLSLVWGLRSQALFHGTLHFLTSFIPVSLFDLESRFFAPTRTCWAPSRAGAVKAGRRSAVAHAPSFAGRALIHRSTAAYSLWSG
jgi:hypothetical protein